MLASLCDRLSDLGFEVKTRYPSINNGGCCVFASLVAEELKRIGVRSIGFIGMTFVDDGVSIDKARDNIKDISDFTEWYNNDIEFNHIGLEVTIAGKIYHYDTDHLHLANNDFGEYTVIPGRLTLQEMVWLANNPVGWNSQFDRSKIPALRKLVKKHFR